MDMKIAPLCCDAEKDIVVKQPEELADKMGSEYVHKPNKGF